MKKSIIITIALSLMFILNCKKENKENAGESDAAYLLLIMENQKEVDKPTVTYINNSIKLTSFWLHADKSCSNPTSVSGTSVTSVAIGTTTLPKKFLSGVYYICWFDSSATGSLPSVRAETFSDKLDYKIDYTNTSTYTITSTKR